MITLLRKAGSLRTSLEAALPAGAIIISSYHEREQREPAGDDQREHDRDRNRLGHVARGHRLVHLSAAASARASAR